MFSYKFFFVLKQHHIQDVPKLKCNILTVDSITTNKKSRRVDRMSKVYKVKNVFLISEIKYLTCVDVCTEYVNVYD